MKHLFFSVCALLVTVTVIYHVFPSTAHTAYVLPINGAGFSISWLLLIALGSLVVYWRMLGKARG